MKSNNQKGTLYLTIATLVFVISSYLVNIILGRVLGPAQYGTFGVLTSLLTSINIAQIAGVPQAVSKYIASDREHADEILKSGIKIQLTLVIGLMIIFLIIAPLAASIFHDPSFTKYLRLMALVLPLYGLYSIFMGYYNGLHAFGKQSVMNIVYSIAKLIFIVGLALLFALKGAIIGFIIAPAIALLYGFKFPRTKKQFPIRTLIMYSIPLIGFAAISTLQLSVDLFSLKALTSVAAIAGFYTAAQNIALVPYLGFSSIGQVLFPNVSRLVGEGKNSEAAKTTTSALRWLLLLMLPLAMLIVATAPNLVHILYGKQYAPAVPMLRVLVIGYIGLTIFSLLANVLNGAGRAKQAMIIAGAGVLSGLIGCVILIPHLSGVGAALGTCIGAAVVMLSSGIFARRVVRYKISIASTIRILIGAVIVLVVGWVVSTPVWFLPIWWVSLGLGYVSWLLITGELNRADIAMLSSLIQSRKRNIA